MSSRPTVATLAGVDVTSTGTHTGLPDCMCQACRDDRYINGRFVTRRAKCKQCRATLAADALDDVGHCDGCQNQPDLFSALDDVLAERTTTRKATRGRRKTS